MKKLVYLFFFCSLFSFGQKDSLELGENYRDDQLYVSFTYNQLFNQPSQLGGSGFSYGFSGGFIKDIPFNKQGNVSLGLGIGYGFDSFNHGLRVSEVGGTINFSTATNVSSNKFSMHTLEFPVEFRWRTSTAKKYKFWRIYSGVKFGYNLTNKFNYEQNGVAFGLNNIENFRKFQYGLTVSAGYDAFNAHIYYGLTSLLENASLGTSSIDTKIIRIGLIFYIL